MAETGKKWVVGIGLYLMVKSILNLFLGFSASNVVTLVVSLVIFVLLVQRVPYIQYIVAVYLALLFLAHIGTNITNFSSNWIYVLEGLLDVGCAAVLVFEKNVKAFFRRD